MGMKETIRRTAFLAAAVAMSNDIAEYFDTGRRRQPERPYQRPADLPKFRIGEHVLFAKDEKTAIKYAKKRGLWKEGCTVEPINEK